MKPFLIASHVQFRGNGEDVHGPAHTVFAYLVSRKVKVTFIKHCIDGLNASVIEHSTGNTRTSQSPIQGVLANVWHVVVTLSYMRHRPVYIGIDPVNGFAGILAKYIGRISYFVYYTPDYTKKRFSFGLLNRFYFFLDRLCVQSSDEVWSVSSRIRDIRTNQGVPVGKNILVPNAPGYISVPRKRYDGNHRLVMVANLTTSVHLEPLLQALQKIKKKCSDISLDVYGGGDTGIHLKNLVKQYGLKHVVIFHGHTPHDTILEAISRAFLGVALYTNASEGTWFGDSMKAREYLACGIPVIINDIPSTADDIRQYEAGFVIQAVDSSTIASCIFRCIDSTEYYQRLRKNALRIAKDCDTSTILHARLKLFLDTGN